MLACGCRDQADGSIWPSVGKTARPQTLKVLWGWACGSGRSSWVLTFILQVVLNRAIKLRILSLTAKDYNSASGLFGSSWYKESTCEVTYCCCRHWFTVKPLDCDWKVVGLNTCLSLFRATFSATPHPSLGEAVFSPLPSSYTVLPPANKVAMHIHFFCCSQYF